MVRLSSLHTHEGHALIAKLSNPQNLDGGPVGLSSQASALMAKWPKLGEEMVIGRENHTVSYRMHGAATCTLYHTACTVLRRAHCIIPHARCCDVHTVSYRMHG
eukprot:Polyplicarium_translucidae@DN3008_c0_g1_i2.p1